MPCSTSPSATPWWHYLVGSLAVGAIATLFIYVRWLSAVGVIVLLTLLLFKALRHPRYALHGLRIDNVSDNAVNRALRGGTLGILIVLPVWVSPLLRDLHPAITFALCTALAPFLFLSHTDALSKDKALIAQHGKDVDSTTLASLPPLGHVEVQIVKLLAAAGAADGSRAQLGSLAKISGIPLEDIAPAVRTLIDARIITAFTALSPTNPKDWYVELTPIGCALASRNHTSTAR